MFRGKTVIAILAIVLFVVSVGFTQSLEENFNDFLHYTKIGRFDLAAGFAQLILESSPDPVELLALSEENPEGYEILLKVNESRPDPELAELTTRILGIIERGRFIRRSEPQIIVQEIERLSSTTRGQFIAAKRLKNAGEYAIPFMLDVIADHSRADELPNIVWALPQIGRSAIRPLAAALQTEDVAVKTEIIKALGKIGYPQSLAYLKYIVDKDESVEMQNLAADSIRQIDQPAIGVSAAQLFFLLAEKYYYHSESLAPEGNADSANIWFWDPNEQRLVWKEVDGSYFNELMAMRCCEWSLRADEGFGWAIGLWLAAFFKAEATGISMPDYFGNTHADALVYATMAGPAYLNQALARAIKDKNNDVALGVIEALATTAGEKSLIGQVKPLLDALSFEDRAVKYSAAIAVAAAGPRQKFAESRLVVVNLAEAIGQGAEPISDANQWNQDLADSYALRAAQAMLQLALTRNPAVDLSIAQDALVSATKDQHREIQVFAGRILAYLTSPGAQRAIAEMALDDNNGLDVRISAFESLATSAKLNANMLPEPMVDAVYEIISSATTDPDLRLAAANAFGALNLPSRKVKDLILDQAGS